VEVGLVTFIVQVGLTTGAGVDPTYFRLDDPVAGLLDHQVLAPPDVYLDLSTDSLGRQRVMTLDIDRSSTQGAGALVEYATGTLTLTLRDDNGDLDPANIAEPIPGIWIVAAYIYGGTVYSLFSGTIDSWLPEHRYPDQAVVVITASDLLGNFAGYDRGALAPTGAGATSGARINAVLDGIGWPASARNIDTGTVTVAATDFSGNALDEMRNVATAEVGDLWATVDGKIRFRSRYNLYTATASRTVQATFGSNAALGELPWVDRLGLSYDRSTMINVVRASRPSGTVTEVGDEVSRSRYHDKAHEELNLPLNDDAQVANWATYVLARDSVPKLRFTDVVIDPRANEAALYPQVLTRDFGDRIAVVRRPPGVTADTRECYIRGIHHSFQAPTTWQTTWELEPAVTGNPFILDDPTYGLLDSTNALIL
jgi:hypothetical protein